MFYGGRGKLSDQPKDKTRYHFDGTECFCLFLPWLPNHAVHVWNWQQERSDWSLAKRETRYTYSAMPIAWSHGLVLRSTLKVWLWLPLFFGSAVAAGPGVSFLINVLGFLMFLFAAAGLLLLWHLDRQDKQIRRLLGRHRLGFSDPYHWTAELKSMIVPASTWFGTNSYQEAARLLIDQQRFSEAMWAARLCMAIEDDIAGLELTEEILRQCPDLTSVHKQEQYPVLSFPDDEAGKFWSEIYSGKSKAFFRETLFSNNLIGSMAAATDKEQPEDEIEVQQQKRLLRRTEDDKLFRAVGLYSGVVISASMVALIFLSFII